MCRSRATTRPPAPGEVDGRRLPLRRPATSSRRLRDAGGFLEWFEVYGDLKGTPREPVEEHLAAGDDVLLEIDVQGALPVRDVVPRGAARVRPAAVAARSSGAGSQARGDRPIPPTLERRLARADAEEAHGRAGSTRSS